MQLKTIALPRMALQTLRTKMIEQSVYARRTANLTMLVLGAITLQACERSKMADKVIYICFADSGESDRALALLHEISGRFDYRFREYGSQAKSDLEIVEANPAVIPDGEPIQADIENGNGEVVLIASNFGSIGEELRVSFFYRREEGEDSLFHQAVVSGLESIEGAQLNFSAAEAAENPCGEN